MRIERKSILSAVRIVALLAIAMVSGWMGYELVLYDEIRAVERQEGKERALLKEAIAKIRKASSITTERKYNADFDRILSGHRRLLDRLDDTDVRRAMANLPDVDDINVHAELLEYDFYTERHATLTKKGSFTDIVTWLQGLSQSDVLIAPQALEPERSEQGLSARFTVALFSVNRDQS